MSVASLFSLRRRLQRQLTLSLENEDNCYAGLSLAITMVTEAMEEEAENTFSKKLTSEPVFEHDIGGEG